MKKLLIFLSWYFTCNLTLILAVVALFVSSTKNGSELLLKIDQEMTSKNTYQMYAALPTVLGEFTQSVETGDSRPVIINDYLKKRNKAIGSEYTDFIIKTAREYEIDPYLIIAIAECESNLGEKIPAGSNNPFGYGIPTGSKRGTEFETWEHAIEAEAKLIKRFADKGMVTPEEMGPIYAPPSVENDGSWAKCVRFFLDKLE